MATSPDLNNMVLLGDRRAFGGFFRAYLLITVFFFCSSVGIEGQGRKADSARAEALKAAMDSKVYYAPQGFHWLEGESRLWYVNPTPRGKEFMLADAGKKTRKAAFDQEELAKGLSAALGKPVKPYELPFFRYHVR